MKIKRKLKVKRRAKSSHGWHKVEEAVSSMLLRWWALGIQ